MNYKKDQNTHFIISHDISYLLVIILKVVAWLIPQLSKANVDNIF